MRCDRTVSSYRSSIAQSVRVVFLTLSIAGLAGCHGGDKNPGQSLVRVNGNEITIHQLNQELVHSAAPQNSGKSAEDLRKQVLEALVDRQLLVGEAVRNKLDRDLDVLQQVERAKSQILAQAYLRSRIEGMPKPSKSDVETYFHDHPEFFAQRKIFELKQLVIAGADLSADLSATMDNAKSLDEVIVWLDAHNVEYAKSQAIRASPDFPAQILSKIQTADKVQLFIVKDGDKAVLMSVSFLKDSPVTLQAASPEITQYLLNKMTQEEAGAELKRLRSTAKLEYMNLADAGITDRKASAEEATHDMPATGKIAETKSDAGLPGVK